MSLKSSDSDLAQLVQQHELDLTFLQSQLLGTSQDCMLLTLEVKDFAKGDLKDVTIMFYFLMMQQFSSSISKIQDH